MKPKTSRPSFYLRILLLFLVIVPLAWARYRAVTGFEGFGVFCPFRSLSGIPCPFCFGTRSWILIMSGEFLEGLTTNPLGFLLFFVDLGAVFWLVVATPLKLPPFPSDQITTKRAFWHLTFWLVMGSWGFVLVRMFSQL